LIANSSGKWIRSGKGRGVRERVVPDGATYERGLDVEDDSVADLVRSRPRIWESTLPRHVQKDPETSLTWTLKDELVKRGKVYYAKPDPPPAGRSTLRASEEACAEPCPVLPIELQRLTASEQSVGAGVRGLHGTRPRVIGRSEHEVWSRTRDLASNRRAWSFFTH
jgi:hypothetical protein